ncbi:YeiH family protein [Desulfonatronovibrio magnus]|uniref:YeiH family protein n=1 Tax=Desulfonatronovibrio magnus TaxID=698827 RepID=UPI0005EAFDA5|nr:putative sulfate exporter family transporter [Desulfonatronovibrio magnus]
MAENPNANVVTETKVSMVTQMYKSEDWWAIWLGALIIIFAWMAATAASPDVDSMYQYQEIMEQEQEMAGFRTIAYTEAESAYNSVRARSEDGLLKTVHGFLATPARWSSNPLDSIFRTEQAAAEIRAANADRLEQARERLEDARARAQAAEDLARAENFQNTQLNAEARLLLGEWRSARDSFSSARSAANTQSFNRIPGLLALMVITALIFAIGGKFMGLNLKEFFIGFPIVFGLAVLSYVIANQTTVRAYGFSYVLWGIVLGMLISNTVGTPKFLKTAAQTEYFIKTGLVLLGASVMFGLILMIGPAGIFVTWVVTPIVLIGTYWFGQKVIKVPSKQLNITVSSDMSVSGVSAAIAAAAASRAKKEELTLAIGMSMVFVVVMIFAIPAFANWVGMHPVWAGAWIGGTVDNTGSVVAAGELIGPEAMYVAATIKMIQNVMIGVMAFGVAAYWCLKVEPDRACAAGAAPVKFTAAGALYEIWYRFPKFILGFIFASILISVLAETAGEAWSYAMINNGILAWANGFRGWFFAIAFVSIGLSINYRELKEPLRGGKPLILYVCGQGFNLILTALVAYIMFMVIFRDITDRLMAMGL